MEILHFARLLDHELACLDNLSLADGAPLVTQVHFLVGLVVARAVLFERASEVRLSTRLLFFIFPGLASFHLFYLQDDLGSLRFGRLFFILEETDVSD